MRVKPVVRCSLQEQHARRSPNLIRRGGLVRAQVFQQPAKEELHHRIFLLFREASWRPNLFPRGERLLSESLEQTRRMLGGADFFDRLLDAAVHTDHIGDTLRVARVH